MRGKMKGRMRGTVKGNVREARNKHVETMGLNKVCISRDNKECYQHIGGNKDNKLLYQYACQHD